MDKTPIIKAIAHLWDTTTTKGRIKLIVSLIIIFFVIGGGGYKLGIERSLYKFDILEAKHERKLTEFESKGIKYISEFSTNDWITIKGQGDQLRIPFSVHMVKNPIIAVQQKEENGNWKDVGCVIEVDKFNNVIISVIYGFDGRIVLK